MIKTLICWFIGHKHIWIAKPNVPLQLMCERCGKTGSIT